MKDSDNYFILITQEKLSGVPYSIREIYTLCSTKKYGNMQKAYTETTLLSVVDEG